MIEVAYYYLDTNLTRMGGMEYHKARADFKVNTHVSMGFH